jgi:hypothetical protein
VPLRYKPKRRNVLRALFVTVIGAPLVRVTLKRPRKKPEELPPVPWIGHC